jgi:hypothetical protein
MTAGSEKDQLQKNVAWWMTIMTGPDFRPESDKIKSPSGSPVV